MKTKFFIAIVFSLPLLSCGKSSGDTKAGQPPAQTVAVPQTENGTVEDTINAYHTHKKVVFLEKADFGISGGDNWLVEDTNNNIYIYQIKDGVILKDYYQGRNFSAGERSIFDIMGGIPGTRIGSGTSAFGDYNNDGIMELFQYGFGGNGTFIAIVGYDSDTDTFINYCGIPGIPFGIIDPEKGPAPVQFTSYKGQDGFKVFYSAGTVAGGEGAPYVPDLKNGRWFFYAWDEAERQYVEAGEVE